MTAPALALPENTVWTPNPGSQALFLQSPVFETGFVGSRGVGKTDALIMSFAQHVGRGFGPEWRGILFRETYKQLRDVVKKSRKWFRLIFPEARFNETKMQWVFPDGEMLIFAHLKTVADYDNYHGHEYPWIGFEELCNWSTPDAYTAMFSCSRSAHPGMPRMVRFTTNPWGAGLNWVKARFRLPQMLNRVIETPGEPDRLAIHGAMAENLVLLENDPDYPSKIRTAAKNPDQLKAWMIGSWDGATGGIFDDVWSAWHHVLLPFQIPQDWEVSRSFDWGSSKPFSVGWWAQSTGSEVVYADGSRLPTVRGDLFRIAEWYGWDGHPNRGTRMLAKEIGQGIIEREAQFYEGGLVHRRTKIHRGPADSSIWTQENGKSVADDMRRAGVKWDPADKSAGSRKQGWEQIRTRLKEALPPGHPAWEIPPRPPGTPREEPAMFIFDTCSHFIRTVPTLPRCERDPDDVNTEAEDHVADETRYRLGWRRKTVTQDNF